MDNLLVQKPQFDTAILCPGTPVMLKTDVSNFPRGNEQIYKRGIIVESSPLELRIEYWKVHAYTNLKDEMAFLTLDVGQVASGHVTVAILKPELAKFEVEHRLKTLLTEVQDTTGRNQEAYVNEVRRQIKVTARLLGIEPENIMPDLFKEALEKHEQPIS